MCKLESVIWLSWRQRQFPSSLKKNKKMAKYNMCEALYALPDGTIIPHKKPILLPLLITIIGVVILVVNGWVLADADLPNLKSALVLFGAVFVMVGGAVLATRIAGKSTLPYHKTDGNFLHLEELKFKKDQKPTVLELLNKGDFATLRQTPSDGVSAFVVEIYSSPKSGYIAAQAFEYIDLELQPASELKIFES